MHPQKFHVTKGGLRYLEEKWLQKKMICNIYKLWKYALEGIFQEFIFTMKCVFLLVIELTHEFDDSKKLNAVLNVTVNPAFLTFPCELCYPSNVFTLFCYKYRPLYVWFEYMMYFMNNPVGLGRAV